MIISTTPDSTVDILYMACGVTCIAPACDRQYTDSSNVHCAQPERDLAVVPGLGVSPCSLISRICPAMTMTCH